MSGDRARYERALARRSLIHHRQREEVLEGLLADFMSLAKEKKCDCPASKALRHLAKELEASDGVHRGNRHGQV